MLKRRSKISFTVNPKEVVAKKEELSPTCGFWLPHGTTILEFPCEDLRGRYHSLKVVHSRLTGTEWLEEEDDICSSLRKLAMMESTLL